MNVSDGVCREAVSRPRRALKGLPVPESGSPIGELVKQFPRLFRGVRLRAYRALSPGWHGLVVELFIDIDRMLDDRAAKRFEVLRIDERFAGLRIYWRLNAPQPHLIELFGRTRPVDVRAKRIDALFERVKARVNRAAVQASATCQLCGQPGSSGNTKGWTQTLCLACSQGGCSQRFRSSS